jgi:hypothetical protein
VGIFKVTFLTSPLMIITPGIFFAEASQEKQSIRNKMQAIGLMGTFFSKISRSIWSSLSPGM